jgi:hypothetical protein
VQFAEGLDHGGRGVTGLGVVQPEDLEGAAGSEHQETGGDQHAQIEVRLTDDAGPVDRAGGSGQGERFLKL